MDKKKIKVVKRSEVVNTPRRRRGQPSKKGAARQIVSNVTGWVAELKNRKSEETKAALELLFTANQRPSES